jgi:type 1 glutamine amidotransferase
LRPRLGVAVVALALAACAPGDGSATPSGGSPATAAYEVLVFTRTAGFRHDSIAAGVRALREIGAVDGFAVTATGDGSAFTAGNLDRYAAVVFLNTTGDVLDPGRQAAFEAYIRGGGGFLGVHAAADTEYDWPFYGQLVGAYFARHPRVQRADVRVVDRDHPATAHLPATWTRTDEWYDFRAPPRGVRVLATLDESSYAGGGMGADHPTAWCRAYAGGRSFYTGGGHTAQAYAEPDFRDHLLGAVRYAAGRTDAVC